MTMKESDIQQGFLHDLCPNIRPLVGEILACPCGCELLEFFRDRPTTWLEVEDIAFYVRQSSSSVLLGLSRLHELGLIERHDVHGMTLYALTEAAQHTAALEQFWIWRDVLRAQWQETRDALEL